MAHFAQVENGIVKQVIVIDNSDITIGGIEYEEKGIEICKNLLGQDTEWVQTSYNGSFRGNYAGIGFIWDGENFMPPEI